MEVTTQPRAYPDVVASLGPGLLRLGLMLTGDPQAAEDLVQETLVLADRHRDRIVAMESPAAYLRRILINRHLSDQRTRARRPRETAYDDLPGHAAAPDQSSGVDHRDEAWRLLATLPPRQRAVLVLRFYEDLADADIAAVLGCSQGTVRSNASRGLATLRTHLSPPEVTR